jgi:signal transduction histidine kinase
MSMTANLSEPIRRAARRSGLGNHDVSLRAVERRRLELWGIVLAMLTAVSVAVVLLSAWPRPAEATSILSAPALRAAMVLLAVGFGAYVMEKEIHLRKLSGLLVDEQVTIEALTRRIEEDTALTTAGRAIHAMLDVEGTLQLILDSGIDLLEGQTGAVHLVERPGVLRCAASRGLGTVGERTPFNERVEGRVAVKREPVLIPALRRSSLPSGFEREDTGGDIMCAPLRNGQDLVGVIRVDAPRARSFGDADLASLAVFADHVAPQMANAQLYQRERIRVGELLEVYRLKADFVSAMVNELAPPLRAMVGNVRNLRHADVWLETQRAVLEHMDRDGTRLLRLVDRLGRQGRHGSRGAAVGDDRVDVGILARVVAAELARRGRPVDVQADDGCVVMGDEEIVQPVLVNLVDNAYRHGAPPVTVRVERTDDGVLISVEDRGPGVPPERRDAVFAGLPPAGEQGPRTGAGLTIVRGVVTALRGTVWVEDVPGGGAAFRIALPSDVPAFLRVPDVTAQEGQAPPPTSAEERDEPVVDAPAVVGGNGDDPIELLERWLDRFELEPRNPAPEDEGPVASVPPSMPSG